MIFKKELLLAAILLLITIIRDVSSCGHSRWKHRTRHHRHRRSPVEYELIYDTSCGENLCTSLANYPERKISSAIKKFDRLVTSDKSVFQRVLVDSGYLNERFQQRREYDEFFERVLKENNCDVETNDIYPLEGQSSDDNELYYIINTPELSQNLERKICKSCKPTDNYVTCHQDFRESKLLAIPIKKRSFNAEDVTVKSFKVPNSCVCFIV